MREKDIFMILQDGGKFKMKPQKEKFTFKGFFAGMLIPTILTCGVLKYNDFTINLNKISQVYADGVDVSPKEVIHYAEKQTEKIKETVTSKLENIAIEGKKQIIEIKEKYLSTANSDTEKIREIIYAESCNQPKKARLLVGKVILNRVGKQGYPKTLDKVLYGYNGFSCANADMNKTWKQAIGKATMNNYDKKVFDDCLNDAEYVLSGKKIGISNEGKIIAYHDARVWYSNLVKDPKHKAYWLNLVHVGRYGNLEFYMSLRDEKIPTKAPYFEDIPKNNCSKYVRSAGEFYGWRFATQETDAWEFSKNNKLVKKVKGSLKGYENYLVPKKSAVTFYFKGSNFHELAMKEAGNKITHVALYMGKNKNGEMCFAENAGEIQRLISYSAMINKGYSPREIVEPLRAIGEN